MTHRFYKDEYNEEFIRQIINNRIKGLTATGQESEKVIIIEGGLEDLKKLSGLMYATPEEIKAAYPEFMTPEDYDLIWKEKVSKVYRMVTDAILDGYNETDGTGFPRSQEENALCEVRNILFHAAYKK